MLYNKKYYESIFRSAYPQLSLPPLDYPQMALPPKLTFELADQPPTTQPTRHQGLFETLLGGRAEGLHIDAEEFPDKYTDETKNLILELVSGQKKDLTDEERRVLDMATLDFASAPAIKKPLPPPPQPVKTAAVEEESEEEEIDYGTPESQLPPFWWK